jgi:hypothetical protein
MTPGARTPSQYVSLFNSSNTYTNTAIDTFGTTWSNGGAGPNLTNYTIPSTTSVVKRYANLQFVGWESLVAPRLNLTGMTTLHVSVWTPAATSFSVKLVSWNTAGTAPTGEFEYQFTNVVPGQWNELNVGLNVFTGVTTSSIGQILIVNNQMGTFFLDNFYFFQ